MNPSREQLERMNLDLITLVQAGQREAADSLILLNEGLIRNVIVTRNLNNSSYLDECLQAGRRGLVRAAEKYDTKKKASFAHYATIWITSKIRRVVSANRNVVHTPYHVLQEYQRAVRNGVKPKVLPSNVVSLNAPPTLNSEIEDWHELLPDAACPVDAFLVDKTLQELCALACAAIFKHLEEHKAQVLRQHFFEDKTFVDIGGTLGVSRQRAQQIESHAIQEIRRWSCTIGIRRDMDLHEKAFLMARTMTSDEF